nr:MAG TPA: protein of unknown function (DUF4969) [Caudoviricetes sp.]
MRRVISVLSLAVLCLLCTACGGNERLDALEAQVSALEDALAQSEEQRISDAYDFQRQLEALTAVGVQVPPPRATLWLCRRSPRRGGPKRPDHRRQHLRRQR